ncbi:MAG: hypothetical protein E7B87_04525, partial [Streptococcus salivarius]|nr:hypothetical protein [Streptococcus salivarius]
MKTLSQQKKLLKRLLQTETQNKSILIGKKKKRKASPSPVKKRKKKQNVLKLKRHVMLVNQAQVV